MQAVIRLSCYAMIDKTLFNEVLTFSDKSEAQYVGLREEKAGAI
jgi:hypothetical protein